MKELAERLIAARNNLRNAEDAYQRARQEYAAAEGAYCDGAGDILCTRVVGDTAISFSGIYPDSRKGEHLEFDTVEVLA